MAAYDDKSPLETDIEEGRMEIWNIMREGLELSETEKLEQLCRMIVAGKMDPDDPWKEFKELLTSLPVELVFIAPYFWSDCRLNFPLCKQSSIRKRAKIYIIR